VRVRNRALSDPHFQRWAARFPLTRGIAHRRATALFDMSAGFVYAQVLHASVRVGLFQALEGGALDATELSARIGLPVSGTERLARAAAALDLLEMDGERFVLGVHGAALLANPAATSMIRHHELLYRDLADPLALLRGDDVTTSLRRFWSYAAPPGTPTDDVAGYSALMADSLALIADDILDAYPFGEHRHLLDVGGGEGVFVEAVARRFPRLRLTLFDLPPVAERARARLDRTNLGSGVDVVGGDAIRGGLPSGADVATLVRVLHDHDDAQALRILGAIRAALAPDGVLVVAEPMADTEGARAMGDAYFGFYLLAMGQGRPRSPDEVASLLRSAGFGRIHRHPTRQPMLTQVVTAHAASIVK
jgi:demethylspheroidene O-methyltransferase